jgi:hypothetical protein
MNRADRSDEWTRETMDKPAGTSDPKSQPACGPKGSLLTSWAAVIALLGVGALPCPDCGVPMAWHLWPLALLILAGKWISRRRRGIKREQASDDEKVRHPQ